MCPKKDEPPDSAHLNPLVLGHTTNLRNSCVCHSFRPAYMQQNIWIAEIPLYFWSVTSRLYISYKSSNQQSRAARVYIFRICCVHSPETRGLSEDDGLGFGALLPNDMKRCWQNSSGSSLSRNVCMKTLKPSKSISWKARQKQRVLLSGLKMLLCVCGRKK